MKQDICKKGDTTTTTHFPTFATESKIKQRKKGTQRKSL